MSTMLSKTATENSSVHKQKLGMQSYVGEFSVRRG